MTYGPKVNEFEKLIEAYGRAYWNCEECQGEEEELEQARAALIAEYERVSLNYCDSAIEIESLKSERGRLAKENAELLEKLEEARGYRGIQHDAKDF